MLLKSLARTSLLPAFLLLAPLSFAQDSPDSVQTPDKQFARKVVISGLSNPWEVTWGPDNSLWITERTGKRITRVDPASGQQKVAITVDEVSAPGGQDGLLGMALHPELLKGTGNDYIYVAYTYQDQGKGPVPYVSDTTSPYRFLYLKVVRFTYNKAAGTLGNPVTLVTGFPAGNDHDAGRLKIGPDRKLYLTLGDRGHNQLGNFCQPIEAQRLPTQKEIDSRNFIAYVGKSLRLNLDGSIPPDNPKLNGVVSHVFTYGHRNIQGISFGPDGTLYASEHGPKTDDEINILKAGNNYGWPHVAGLKDNNAYEYARWAEASTPCSQLKFSDLAIHPSVPREPESAFTKPFTPPIATMFTVPTGFNFHDPKCNGVDYICWPTVGASSIEYYESKGKGIPGWDKVLLVTALKRGSLYVAPLSRDGQKVNGHMWRYFQSENRYRDLALNPDGRTIYIATDSGGMLESYTGGFTTKVENPGAILAFTYEKEGAPSPVRVSRAGQPASASSTPAMQNAIGAPPQFTAAQAAAGKAAYNGNCAVCHGNNMLNGTMGPPLAGEHFARQWKGKTVASFFEKSAKMPPNAPKSLPADVYANIVAYILETNGYQAGGAKLTPQGAGVIK